MLTKRLSRASLNGLHPSVRRPRYDPAEVTPGIVHLGLGGFHRAHMARYTHELMDERRDALCWGIVGAGLLASDIRMRDALAPQDGLYTLVERDGSTERAMVIGSIPRVIFAGASSTELLDAIAGPAIRVVSLTVTENGYCLDAATKRLNPDHPAIASDLANPARPHTAIGIIVEALRHRRDTGRPAFTVLSCDNIQNNGAVLCEAVLDFARARDPGLGDWISGEGRFPSTMVDRITPGTRPEDVADLAARYGVSDAWPVFSEIFSQWVIEDNFVDGRPGWEAVGAQFVTDVTPYELMKLRLLNASHLAVAGLGRLMGYSLIDEAMRDLRIEAYMIALMEREIGPTLRPVPGVDLADYKAKLVARLANPTIKDTVERVNTDAPINVLVDPLRDRVRNGQSTDLLALGLAAWMRRMTGLDEAGTPMAIRHPLAGRLRERAMAGGPDPRPILGIRELFGDLGDNPAFVSTAGRWLSALYRHGAAKTLDLAQAELGFGQAIARQV